jgi:hypothetical protein
VTECEVLVQAQFYYMDDACDSVGLLCSVLLTRFVTVCQTDTKKSFQFFFILLKIMDRRIFHDFSVKFVKVYTCQFDFSDVTTIQF